MRWGGFGVNKLYETSNIKNICMLTWATEDFQFLTVFDKKQRQKYKVIGHYRVKLTFTLGPAPAGVVWAGQEAAAGRDPVLGVGVGGVHPDLTVAAWWGGVTLCCPHCSAGGSLCVALTVLHHSRGWAGCSLHWLVAAGCWDAGPWPRHSWPRLARAATWLQSARPSTPHNQPPPCPCPKLSTHIAGPCGTSRTGAKSVF